MQAEQATRASCKPGELVATLEAAVGCSPSPELNTEDLITGSPSPAMLSILHWCTARAMELELSQVRLTHTTFVTADRNRSQTEDEPSLMFFDLKWGFCADGVARLPPGAAFEHRLASALQDFAAFPRSVLRILVYSEDPLELRNGSVFRWSTPLPMPSEDDRVSLPPEDDNFLMRHLFWMGPGAVLIVVLLMFVCMCSVQLRRKQLRNAILPQRAGRAGLMHSWGGGDTRDIPQGPGGGNLASVVHSYDPNTEDGTVFATAAGLESFECLKAAEGDLLEVFARGEGWLYGRISGSGLFGYLPEDCVLWVDGVGASPSVDNSCSQSAVVQNHEVAEHRTEPEVFGRQPLK